MGRYAEQVLGLPEINDLYVMKQYNNTFYCITYQGDKIISSKDLINWDILYMGFNESMGILDFSVEANGIVYILYNENTNSSLETKLISIDNKKVTQINSKKQETLTNPSKIEILANNDIILLNNLKEVLRFSSEGTYIKSYSLPDKSSQIAIFGEELAALSVDNMSVTVINLETSEHKILRSEDENSGGLLVLP